MSPVQKTGGAEKGILSIALWGGDDERRRLVGEMFASQPGVRVQDSPFLPGGEEVSKLADQHDAVIVDIDYDPERSLEVVGRLTADGRAYVMAYTAKSDMKLAIRFMRAGVQEFLAVPLDPAEVTAALERAQKYLISLNGPEKPAGKLFVFQGTKGGCGVTTLASNFALALAQESEQSTLLIDLGQPLGDVGINLGMTTQYSVVDAMRDADRLDSNFLKSLVTTHSSGFDVLPAPNEFREVMDFKQAIDKFATVVRQSYDFVVVDVGSRIDLIGTALYEQCEAVYLITQVGISELRNANRMITQFFAARKDSLQIVLNRYTSKALLFDDSQIAKTLTRSAQWKIPDDWAAARRTRNTATPMVLVDSPISQGIREMARSAAGIAGDKETKRGLFRLLR